MPLAGYRDSSNSGVIFQTDYAYYWSSSPRGGSNLEYAWYLFFNSSYVDPSDILGRACGLSVRCFKNEYVAPDSTWTVIQGTL